MDFCETSWRPDCVLQCVFACILSANAPLRRRGHNPQNLSGANVCNQDWFKLHLFRNDIENIPE
eukprot:5986601-Lingulodinium_polyedra.AAC.1